MKPLKSIECLTLDTPSFAQGNRVDERVRARCRYCCSVSPTTIPIAPTGVPDGSRVCSSSHGSLGCFHIIQPIRWAGFGSLIINVDSIQSIFRHFSTTSTTRRYIYSKATTRARAVGYAKVFLHSISREVSSMRGSPPGPGRLASSQETARQAGFHLRRLG